MIVTKNVITPVFRQVKTVERGKPTKLTELQLNYGFQIEKEQKRAETITKRVLKNNLVARNSDLWLIFLCWLQQGIMKEEKGVFSVKKEKISDLIKPESITRARRTINYELNQYLPTDPQIITKRRIKQECMKERYNQK